MTKLKSQNKRKLKNLNFEETQKLKMGENLTIIVTITKLSRHSKYDKT